MVRLGVRGVTVELVARLVVLEALEVLRERVAKLTPAALSVLRV